MQINRQRVIENAKQQKIIAEKSLNDLLNKEKCKLSKPSSNPKEANRAAAITDR